jgi:hypothetical protein
MPPSATGNPARSGCASWSFGPARERPADPIELLLAELMATRYALLNLFHATALAGAEGKQLFPDSVLKIRDQADSQKRKKPASYCRISLPRQRIPGVEKHEADAVSAKVSLADCASIAALLGSAFLASGTLVLAGLAARFSEHTVGRTSTKRYRLGIVKSILFRFSSSDNSITSASERSCIHG